MKRSAITRLTTVVGIAMAASLALVGCAPPTTVASEPTPTGTWSVTLSQTARDLLPSSIKTGGVLGFGSEAGRAPFRYYLADGTLTGLEVDMGNALGEILGVKIRYDDVSGLAATLLGLTSQRYDVAFGPFLPSADRLKSYDYVNFMTNTQSVIVPAASSVKSIPGDLCGLTVAYQENTTSLAYLTAASTACTTAGKAAVTASSLSSQEALILAVQAGRVDGAASASPIAQWVAKQNTTLREVEDSSKTSTLGVLIAKDRTDLAAAMTAAYQELFKSGAYAAIMAKWGLQTAMVDAPARVS